MQPDVVIVGAGLAGMSLAWHLAPHRRVLVLEQGTQVGAEASSQNAAMVRRLGEDPFERALAVRSAAWMAAPGERWSAPAPARTVGAVLGLTVDPYHLHDAVAHLRARGVTVEALDDASDVAPALAGAPLEHAWWMPHEQVGDPWAMLQGFHAGLTRAQGTVRTRTTVQGLVTEGERVLGVHTTDGPIHAGAVVIAAGAWSQALVAPLGLRRPLVPLRRTLLQSDPHPVSRPEHPWVWIDDVGVYARPEAGGWLVSGCDEAVDPPIPGPGSRGSPLPEHRALAATKLDRWLPVLADATLRTGWTGLRTFAPDRRPFLGSDPDAPGLWWATGLGGYGVTCAYGVGEVVAAWMQGQETPWLRPSAVSPARAMLRRWPIRPHGDISSSKMIRA